MARKIAKQKGFLLISILLAICIIAILYTMYYRKSGSQTSSPAQAGQRAVEQIKENNQTQINQQIEIQNQLNSVDK